ncbi:MAG: ATP-dependent helicase [Candidatus Woesearchaeota archaeon]|nr:ATP-dependent helicase [Candidatus Woesearchaeota archaeon]
MQLEDIKKELEPRFYEVLKREDINELRPAQEKAIKQGLFSNKNMLVCTPTASGKTLIAEFAMINELLKNPGSKVIYLAPLKALVNEKYKDFSKRYGSLMNVAKSTGDLDSSDSFLERADLILTTPEKLDSLIRHKVLWLRKVKVLVVDEIHLLNDIERGPVLEVIITLLRTILKDLRIIGLSATIGNAYELADWLDAELVIDNWRPVKLKQGVLFDNEVEFFE